MARAYIGGSSCRGLGARLGSIDAAGVARVGDLRAPGSEPKPMHDRGLRLFWTYDVLSRLVAAHAKESMAVDVPRIRSNGEENIDDVATYDAGDVVKCDAGEHGAKFVE